MKDYPYFFILYVVIKKRVKVKIINLKSTTILKSGYLQINLR